MATQKVQNPGELRHRLTIERMQSLIDTSGEFIGEGWAPVGKVWGRVAPLSARELLESASIQSEVVARITIRYRSDIDAKCRILHRGSTYNIAGIVADNVSGIEYLTLPVTRGLNEG